MLRNGAVSPGEYVAGWIKRWPTGVIGTNKKDAHETAAALLQDAAQLPRAPRGEPQALASLLADRGVQVLTLEDWGVIDAAEIALGQQRGRARTVLHDRASLLDAVRASAPQERAGH